MFHHSLINFLLMAPRIDSVSLLLEIPETKGALVYPQPPVVGGIAVRISDSIRICKRRLPFL